MTEEEKIIEQRIQPWRFWLFATLTAFLVVTFGLYLPLRFRHQGVEDMMQHGDHMPMGEMDERHVAAPYREEGEVREGLAVNLNVTPVPLAAGTSTRLDFFVNQKPGSVPVTDFEIEHEKLMHVIGVRNDLNEFLHIHSQPTLTPGILTVPYTFTKPGLYKLWSEIKKDGIVHTFGHPEFNVEGVGERSGKQVSFARNVIVGDYQIALRLDEPVAVRRETELLFDVHTLDSFETGLENYLGEKIHLTVIKDDWKQFIHAHPTGEKDHHGMFRIIPRVRANGGGDDMSEGGHAISFQIAFREPGLYKAFVQFRPLGIGLPPDEALTAAFWIKVEERAPAIFSAWWRNLLVSAGAIAVLSLVVRRSLRPKMNE